MNHFTHWRYELIPKRTPDRKREGALIRYDWGGGRVGYADCHPWPELGDAPLEEQLNGRLTQLMHQTIWFSMHDAGVRMARRSLFRDLQVPPSHASLTEGVDLEYRAVLDELDRVASEGFGLVKMKAGNHPDSDFEILGKFAREFRSRNLKLRLDLNAKLSPIQATDLLKRLRTLADGLEWIDWIEDACPFDVSAWKGLREEFRIRLAFDLAGNPSAKELAASADVIVVKPAIRNAQTYSTIASWAGLPVCVTSYLDHPVGQAFAAWFAASKQMGNVKYETCGLLTHEVYEPTEFSEQLKTNGPFLIPPGGTGIGFDDLLENLPWVELK